MLAGHGEAVGTSPQKTIYATEQDRPDVALARRLWREGQSGFNFAKLVFVDETGTTTAMTRTHGWGRKGEKLYGRTPHGHWMTQTFVAGLSHRDLSLAHNEVPLRVGVNKTLYILDISASYPVESQYFLPVILDTCPCFPTYCYSHIILASNNGDI